MLHPQATILGREGVVGAEIADLREYAYIRANNEEFCSIFLGIC